MAHRDTGAVVRIVAAARVTVLDVALDTFELVLEDDVYDARDGVRAVDRGARGLDDIDAVDEGGRYCIQVDLAAWRGAGEQRRRVGANETVAVH